MAQNIIKNNIFQLLAVKKVGLPLFILIAVALIFFTKVKIPSVFNVESLKVFTPDPSYLVTSPVASRIASGNIKKTASAPVAVPKVGDIIDIGYSGKTYHYIVLRTEILQSPQNSANSPKDDGSLTMVQWMAVGSEHKPVVIEAQLLKD
jgi:hypothetical protein